MALFGKKKGLVGLDIGSSAVKAVELKAGGKGRRRVPARQPRHGAAASRSHRGRRDHGPGAVIDAIQRLFQTQKIKTTEVATAVSGNAVIVKKISLPRMTQEELAESIHWEAEQYIPFDIQDVALDYEVLEGGTGGNMDVLLVAVKKDKISDYTSVISQAGKSPQIVDVDVFALQNCYEVNYGIDPGRVVALLNVGAAITNINIIKGATSIFNRDIAVGRQPVHRCHPKDLSLSFDQAETLKKGERVEGAAPENLRPMLQQVSESIAPKSRRPSTSSGHQFRGSDRPHLPGRWHGQGAWVAGAPRRPVRGQCRAAEPVQQRHLQPAGLRPRLHQRDRPRRRPSRWGWLFERWATDDPHQPPRR